MNFYTPEDALNYLKGKVGELFAARGALQDAYGRAQLARSKAVTPQDVAKIDQLISDLTVSIQDQSSLESKVRSVVPESWIPQTLGLIPLVIAGVGAIAIAGAVYLHLQRVSQHQQTLNMIEKGILTPAQATALESSSSLFGSGGLTGLTGNMSTLMIGGAVLYGLFLFGPMVAKAFKR